MLDYEKLYRIMFNGLTDAIECLENGGGCLRAKEMLIKAQQVAENYYIECDGEDGECPNAPVYVLPHDTY